MATPFANPERQFQARRDTSPAPIHNIYTFYESESSESESEDVGEIDIETLTLEQYLTLNLNNTSKRIRNPEDTTFEIKGQFLRELHKSTFSGSSTENAIEHIGKVLKIASLFNTNDSALLRPRVLMVTLRVLQGRLGTIIAVVVIKAVKEFFTNGVLLKEFNHTIIALIPKIISNRMKESLSNLISLNQSAFVPGRLNIQKAYDTVDWKFLKEILAGFGFHSRMIGWIMECVTSTSFSISINGCLHGYFKGKQGLRQGDPMSPYLFTLVMEVLTLMLNKRARDLMDSHIIGILNVLPFEEGTLPVKYLGVPLVPS
ncbi:putative RNA-directed DNA polymerase, eukaryota, reverse transcriptase zinc-binding domain protein [Tanacetum coccineum]